MLEAIKEKLRAAGLTVYDFAEKIGTCKAPYVVVYDSGVEVTPGTKGMYGRHTYEVACLTPYTDVDGLAALERRVRQAMHAPAGAAPVLLRGDGRGTDLSGQGDVPGVCEHRKIVLRR